MAENEVVLYADGPAWQALKEAYHARLLNEAKHEHFGTEFLSLKMAVKTVEDLTDDLENIARYSSSNSEAIMSNAADHIRSEECSVGKECVSTGHSRGQEEHKQ